MIQYTNSFRCAINNDNGEVLINFYQQSPLIEADGTISGSKEEVVSEMIMPNAVARQLVTALANITTSNSDN